MRCAGSSVLLLLLLSLSALSASSAQANEERMTDIAGRKWLRGRSAMAARGHGDSARNDKGLEGKVAKNTGANQEADHAYAEAVHDESKGSASRHMFQQGASDLRSHDDAAITASDMLRVDYNVNPADVHSRRPINNDAPLDEIAEKKP